MGSWIKARMRGHGALYSGKTRICSVHYELTVDRATDGSFLTDGYFDAGSHPLQGSLADLNLRLSSGEHVTPRFADVRPAGRVYFRICDPVSTGICIRAAETTPASFLMSLAGST